jgi:hypothetical protein
MPATRVGTRNLKSGAPDAAAAADPLDGAAPADPLLSPSDAASAATASPAPSRAASPSLGASSSPAGEPNVPGLVPLPSRFKPAAFFKASQTRGIRPRALKEIDSQLSAVDATADPAERFQRLTALQRTVDGYVFRYGKDDSRGNLAFDLKRWLDGAVTLRAPLFPGHKVNEDR